MASFNTMFKKFGASGLNFYFVNIIRKTLFTIFLTVVPQILSEKQSGPVQLFLSLFVSLAECAYIVTRLPYLKMSDNCNEINVVATQIAVLVPPGMGFLGLLTWEEVQAAMTTLSFGSIGYVHGSRGETLRERSERKDDASLRRKRGSEVRTKKMPLARKTGRRSGGGGEISLTAREVACARPSPYCECMCPLRLAVRPQESAKKRSH
jgi:hypothetical protein